MVTGYREQIRAAILDKVSLLRRIHKKDVKSIIDEIKLQFLWDSRIALEDLKETIKYFKKHWRDLKVQANLMRKVSSLSGVTNYQI